MAAGALGSIIGQRIERLDREDRCLPRRSVRLALAFAICAVVLTACAWDPPTIERTPREAAGNEPSAKSRLGARKGGAQNGTAPGGVPGEKIDVPGEMASLDVDLTNFKERLIGLDSDEINDLMGAPSLERAEPPALIWQYRHQVCTVDIFMFDDGGGSSVDHVEVRPTSGNSVNEKECFTALMRNVPQAGGGSARASAGQQPIVPSPSTPVGRRATPSAAPPSGPAQTPSSSRPPAPSTAAPSAAPTAPAARPPAAAPAIPEGEEGPPPTDTDVDFDFGAPPAAATAPGRAPSAAPSSEAIPTLPPEFSDEIPSGAKPAPPPASSNSLGGSPGIEIPSAAAGDDDEFADPLDTAPAPAPAAIAKPASPAPAAKPAPAPVPLAVVPPPPPSIPPPPATVATPAPSAGPAPLSPRSPTATAAAQPKGAAKGGAKGAPRAAEDIDDEDLPLDVLGRREDDPSRNDEDMVE